MVLSSKNKFNGCIKNCCILVCIERLFTKNAKDLPKRNQRFQTA